MTVPASRSAPKPLSGPRVFTMNAPSRNAPEPLSGPRVFKVHSPSRNAPEPLSGPRVFTMNAPSRNAPKPLSGPRVFKVHSPSRNAPKPLSEPRVCTMHSLSRNAPKPLSGPLVFQSALAKSERSTSLVSASCSQSPPSPRCVYEPSVCADSFASQRRFALLVSDCINKQNQRVFSKASHRNACP
jgi:hypothetical protein